MQISLKVIEPSWESIYRISKSVQLVKGRHGLYHEIVAAAGQIHEQFGCYAWGNPDVVFYIGSFSQDYKHGNYTSNLHGRVHNYLQNHRMKKSGQKNTNLMVFESINQALISGDISFYLYRFTSIEIGIETISFSQYSSDSDLVRALEQLLICSYKRIGQCSWNRE